MPIGLLAALTSAILVVGSDEMVLSPLLWRISHAFHVPVNVAALAVSAYGFALATGAPLLARIGDRKGRWAGLLLGLAGFAGASLLCALAVNFSEFLLGRIVSGLAAGLVVPHAYALAGEVVPAEFRGRAMGVVVSGWSWSFIIGLPGTTFLARKVGWPWVFVAFALTALILVVSMGLMSKRRPLRTPMARDAQTNARVSLFGLPGVVPLLVATFGNMFGFYGMYTFFGVAWHLHAAITHIASGALLVIYGIGFTMSIVTGRWADRFGHPKSLVISLVSVTAVLSLLPYATTRIGLIACVLFVWGVMQSLTVTLLSASLSQCSEAHRSQIMGWYSFATNTAVTLSAAAMGWLFVRVGYTSVSVFCAASTALAAVCAWMAQRVGG